MNNPKSEQMVKTLDTLTANLFGRSRTESIQRSICVVCGKPANVFHDGLSRKEYSISGLCQLCQDSVITITGGK